MKQIITVAPEHPARLLNRYPASGLPWALECPGVEIHDIGGGAKALDAFDAVLGNRKARHIAPGVYVVWVAS